MVLPLLIPTKPRVRVVGLPNSLERLAGRPQSMLGDPSLSQPLNTSNTSNSSRCVDSIDGRAVSKRIDLRTFTSDTATSSCSGSWKEPDIEKLSTGASLTPSEHKRREWTSTVVKVCKPHPNRNRPNKPEKASSETTAKPFSNFQKRRNTSENPPKNTTKIKKHSTDRRGTPGHRDPLGGKIQATMFVPASITTKDFQLFGKAETNLADLYVRPTGAKGRRVRFQSDDDMLPDAASVSLDSTISTISSFKSKRSSNSSSKCPLDISSHRCARAKKLPDNEIQEQQFWTLSEIDNVRQSAKEKVQKFQAKHPATVRQVEQLFGEFCSINNKKDELDVCEEDEEMEEMLRAFLEDWAAFGLRGLEEDVTARQVFREDRSMATGSVLTYQERLKAQERNQRMFALYAPTAQESIAALEQRAELLRARSESASHRSRMFAMYMALGDALFVANEDQTMLF